MIEGDIIIKSINKLFKFFNSEHPLEEQSSPFQSEVLKGELENDVNELKAVFEKSSDIVYRELHIGNKKGMLIF